MLADYDIKPPERIWREVLAGLEPLLRAAGIEGNPEPQMNADERG